MRSTGRRKVQWRTLGAASALVALSLSAGTLGTGTAVAGGSGEGGCGGCDHDGRDDRRGDDDDRDDAARKVTCRRGSKKGETIDVKLLGINDFHGQLSAGRFVAGRPVGSAPVLASYLLAAAAGWDDRVLLVHAGDHVGASPAASALLQDEPSISFLNIMNEKLGGRGWWGWQVVGTLGNHEFDEGRDELKRLVFGGNHASGPFLEKRWRGARFPYVCANVVDTDSERPLVLPYVVRRVDGVKIGFVGAVTKTTPTIVTPTGVAGLTFGDEADAINDAVKSLKRWDVETIVVLIHEGGVQTSFTGPTPGTPATVSGAIGGIVARLDDEVDLVVSGHSHAFTNALLPNSKGNHVLVTQSFSGGTAYSDVTLTIDRSTGDVTEASASIVTTFADAGPGLAPDADVAALTRAAEDAVAPLVNQVVATAAADLVRTENAAGESTLGNLIADAQRAAMGTDFAFMNPGGIRADVLAGTVTWGELFAVQPFGNSLVKMELTGAQVVTLLEQQWLNQPFPRILEPSGITWTWDAARPVGSRVVEARKGGVLLDPAAKYTVTVNSFMAAGGDNFTVLPQGTNQVGGPVDLDALIAYLAGLAQPVAPPALGRITRLN